MHSIAFILAAEEELDVEENNDQRSIRRSLRDCSNPLELPQSLFQQYYRVNKPAFKYLLDVLMASSPHPRKSFGVPPIIKLSASLRFFAEGGYQKGVGEESDIGLAQSTFSEVLSEIVSTFERRLCPIWIRMPTTAEGKMDSALSFYEKHQMPGIIGCIDGTHVRIIAPTVNKHLYYNRKGFYSLNVLLVCDNEMRIRYVDATHPGACHDSTIWNVSELRMKMEQDFLMNSNSFRLLGDAGYPLEPWLLTPYRTPDKGSTESKFNRVHASCRNVIDRTNGVLKNKWKCLLGAKELHYKPEKAIQIVNVCCALHNICRHYNPASFNTNTSSVGNSKEKNDADNDGDDFPSTTNSQYKAAGQRIRTEISNSLL